MPRNRQRRRRFRNQVWALEYNLLFQKNDPAIEQGLPEWLYPLARDRRSGKVEELEVPERREVAETGIGNCCLAKIEFRQFRKLRQSRRRGIVKRRAAKSQDRQAATLAQPVQHVVRRRQGSGRKIDGM